jgi:hypothetical protein
MNVKVTTFGADQLAELFGCADKIDSGIWTIRELIVDAMRLGYEMAVHDVETEIGVAGLPTVGLGPERRALVADGRWTLGR